MSRDYIHFSEGRAGVKTARIPLLSRFDRPACDVHHGCFTLMVAVKEEAA